MDKDIADDTNQLYVRQKLIGKVREYAESLKDDKKEENKDRLAHGIVDECIAALNKLSKSHSNSLDKPKSPQKSPNSKLRQKEFVARNSLLTELFEIEHFRTLRNIFIAVFLILVANSIVDEYYTKSSEKLQLILWNFNAIDRTFYIWISMFTSTFILVHVTLKLWSIKADKCGIWNKSWLAIYVVYLGAFFYLPTKYVLTHELTPVCSMIILTEQLRMIMKTHSYVRHNAAKVLENPNTGKCPSISKYLYFLFVPTLIYRDEYPRTSHIRVKFVLTNFCQVIACMIYMTIVVCDHFLVYKDFGLSSCESRRVIKSMLSGIVPGISMFVCANFLLLHSWMNAFAELLRFADRQFYTDWWNSYNFAMYYRTWNIVVHDWLFNYIFRDLALLFPSKRLIPVTAVFLLSSVIHDYIIIFVLRFCLPVYLIMFGIIGGLLFFVPQKGNRQNLSVLFWVGLMVGNSIMACLYSIEYYARRNCSPYSETFLDLVVPRMWACYRNDK